MNTSDVSPKKRARRKRHPWQVGDLLAVPLSDGTRKLGQIVAYQPGGFLRSIVCGVTLRDLPEGGPVPASLDAGDFIAVQHVTPDALTYGDWPVIGHAEVPNLAGLVDPRILSAHMYIGQEVSTSGIFDKLLKACMGLRPWDEMHDPRCYESMLLSPEMKPERVILSKVTKH